LDFYEEAITSYDKAIEFKPDYAEAWYYRNKALKQLGCDEEANVSYKQAIKFKPYYAETSYYPGKDRDELGSHEEVIDSYKKANTLSSDIISLRYWKFAESVPVKQ
jgi:tetratricopeptide (TPR) repeat protein